MIRTAPVARRSIRCIVPMVALALTGIASPSRAQRPTAPGASASLSPFARAKAERLLREKHGCLGCHALGNDGGTLAPALHDVRTRRDAAYIAGMIADPQATKPGVSMPRIRMPERERTLIIRYLGGDPAAVATGRASRVVGAGQAAGPRSAPADGRALYQGWCAGCHGPTGAGDGPNARALPVPPARHNDARAMSARSDDALFDTIEAGGAVMNRHPRMPAFGGTLGTTEIRTLVAYIRTLCACQGPAWSRDGGR